MVQIIKENNCQNFGYNLCNDTFIYSENRGLFVQVKSAHTTHRGKTIMTQHTTPNPATNASRTPYTQDMCNDSIIHKLRNIVGLRDYLSELRTTRTHTEA